MNDSNVDSRTQDASNTDVWGTGLKKRLAKRAGIDSRLIKQLDEPIQMPSLRSIHKDVARISSIIGQLELEKKKCEKEKRNAENQICSGFISIESCDSGNASTFAEATIEDQITRIWEENKLRHIESERKILYPTSEHLTHEIDITRVIHRNTVSYNHNRVMFIPVIAKQTRERYRQYVKSSKQYNKLRAHWRLTHHEEEETPSSRGWKDENESKREKRSLPTRSMARITRSQTTNMVECESQTPRDPEFFYSRQADVANRYQEPSKYHFVNHNNKLTQDGKPMICQDIPRTKQCPEHCNCPYQLNEEGKRVRPWTDMEKFIFLNGFFNRPKDFRYIASTLTNRSVQDVIDFYYLNKRGMYVKLLLRVQLSMWKNMNYDSRPLLLAAAYGIGLPIPEKVFCPNYADYDISEFIKDDHPDDEMLLHHPTYSYRIEDNQNITPALLLERKNIREKRIEQLLLNMGVDLKHCIPVEDKMEASHEAHGSLKEKERDRPSFRQILGSDEEEKIAKRRKVYL